jgi:hypothetical protein
MENVWGMLVREVFADCRQFETVGQLKQALLHAWEKIKPEALLNLVSSMPERIFQVINRDGGVKDY